MSHVTLEESSLQKGEKIPEENLKLFEDFSQVETLPEMPMDRDVRMWDVCVCE